MSRLPIQLRQGVGRRFERVLQLVEVQVRAVRRLLDEGHLLLKQLLSIGGLLLGRLESRGRLLLLTTLICVE